MKKKQKEIKENIINFMNDNFLDIRNKISEVKLAHKKEYITSIVDRWCDVEFKELEPKK